MKTILTDKKTMDDLDGDSYRTFVATYDLAAFQPDEGRYSPSSVFESRYGSYSLGMFASLYAPKVVRLYEAERRLGMSRASIISILEEAGFNIPNTGGFYLTTDHIRVLSKAYERSLRQLFKKVRKSVNSLSEVELQQHSNFFRPFVNSFLYSYDVDIFSQELDSFLIENWFFKLVTSDPSAWRADSFFFSILRRLRFKLQRLFKDIRTQIFSIVVSHHYHIFPGEEVNSEKANKIVGFSDSFFKSKRKAIINSDFIKAFTYEKYRNTNLQYHPM